MLHKLSRTIKKVDWRVCLRCYGQGQATSDTATVNNSLNVGSLDGGFNRRILDKVDFVLHSVDVDFC